MSVQLSIPSTTDMQRTGWTQAAQACGTKVRIWSAAHVHNWLELQIITKLEDDLVALAAIQNTLASYTHHTSIPVTPHLPSTNRPVVLSGLSSVVQFLLHNCIISFARLNFLQ
jgi:hypothetical protein